MTTDSQGPVLVVGATGSLGSKVVAALRARGRPVHALVRPGSRAAHIEGEGVRIVRGDMMDRSSLDRALSEVDAVVATAAGYMRRRKTDNAEIDIVGYRHLAEAAAEAGVGRFALLSILDCDTEAAQRVPHFHHKALAEQHLEELGVPTIALRAPPFLDQSPRDYTVEQVRAGRVVIPGDPDTELSYVYTPDLARWLAEAVDLPAEAVGSRIDIGWARPLSGREMHRVLCELLGTELAFYSVPEWLVGAGLGVAGLFSGFAADMGAMYTFTRENRWVADTALQARWLDLPTPEDALGRWLRANHLHLAGDPPPPEPRVLIVGRNPRILDTLVRHLQEEGRDVVGTHDPARVRALLEAEAFDLALLGGGLSDGRRDEIRALIRSIRPDLPIHLKNRWSGPFGMISFANRMVAEFKEAHPVGEE